MCAAGCYPQNAAAEEFTGKQFLEWPRESQTAYITHSITMTAIVALRVRPEISSCLDDWYPLDPAVATKRQNFILKTIRDNPEYHPQATLLVLMEQQCGSFSQPQ